MRLDRAMCLEVSSRFTIVMMGGGNQVKSWTTLLIVGHVRKLPPRLLYRRYIRHPVYERFSVYSPCSTYSARAAYDGVSAHSFRIQSSYGGRSTIFGHLKIEELDQNRWEIDSPLSFHL